VVTVGMTADRPKRVLALLAWASALASNAVCAQDLATERLAMLPSFGDVEQTEVSLFPVRESPGLVFTHPVARPEAESLRIHLVRADQEAVDGTWEIRVLLPSGELKSRITHDELESGSYWTDEYVGSKVTVEIHSTVEANPIEIKIADIAVAKIAPIMLSITGEGNLTPIGSMPDWVQDMGKSIARLRFVADDRKIYTCTAFLITTDLLLTNQHCIAGTTELESAIVDFDYDTVIADTVFTRLSILTASNYDLDYSIVEMRDTVDRQPLAFDPDVAANDDQLLIIQHPLGEPKQVSVQDCLVSSSPVTGRGDSNTKTDFEHSCDTLKGSSGAPVVDRQQQLVVGLHHLGFEEGNSALLNRAVHISTILDDLDDDVRKKILTEENDNEECDE